GCAFLELAEVDVGGLRCGGGGGGLYGSVSGRRGPRRRDRPGRGSRRERQSGPEQPPAPRQGRGRDGVSPNEQSRRSPASPTGAHPRPTLRRPFLWSPARLPPRTVRFRAPGDPPDYTGSRPQIFVSPPRHVSGPSITLFEGGAPARNWRGT